MQDNHSQVGKRVEEVVVNDNPHERYQMMDPFTNEVLDNGIPILTKTPKGNLIRKNVEYSIINCPECETPARYSHKSEPVCPDCGIICLGSTGISKPKIIRDAKTAGRVVGSNN